MPSNADLIKTALELAAELKLEITTDGLKNDELAALVKDLRAKLDDAATQTQADTAAQTGDTDPDADEGDDPDADEGDDPDADAGPLPHATGYEVAPGCSVTTIRGVQTGAVSADDFVDGNRALARLVELGIVKKV